MNALQYIEKCGQPWVSSVDITKATGMSTADVREELNVYLEEELVIKIGNKRSTRYGLYGTEEPKGEVDDFTDAIRNIMLERKDKVDRKTLSSLLGTYDMKMFPSLMKMVESGEVSHNDKKKGQLYWLAAHDKEGIIKHEVKEVKVSSSRKFKIDEDEDLGELPEITDPVELVKFGLNRIPDGQEYMVLELAKVIVMSHNNHSFSQYGILKTLRKVYSQNLDDRLHILRRRDLEYVWRYYYCVGNAELFVDGERAARMVNKEIETTVMTKAIENAIKNEKLVED